MYELPKAELPWWVSKMRTFGEAAVINTRRKTGGQTKLADRGSPVMFIGCEWT